ncbi:hypothetical protein F4553_002004 [Allocatelliglobosispora scoriae]|uniref:Uncharacterized protein n=1 Tax=Allocatelliglobosispora scoriae TaxID=643052 RepID=A0A841BLU5_9ACTN|nr:hypothetical protein [Allocatelliglobosispora scoriae]MBB5868625.1 hypothetical protein [Allocatelliglobosispora scoriae]
MSTRRIPKHLIQARRAETGETYQQAHAALARQIPEARLRAPEDDSPCVGRCTSQFKAADSASHDGGSMVDCAACPGAVCLECQTRAVDEPFARCSPCETAIEDLARAQRLADRCAGRICITRAQAGTSDSASYICDLCNEPTCHCGRPVEHGIMICDPATLRQLRR